MSERHPNVVNEGDLPWAGFAAGVRAMSPADAGRGEQFGVQRKMLGRAAGAQKLGCSLHQLAAGSRSVPFHYHLLNEEAIYILDGAATLRLGDREIAVAAGDYIALPVGAAHAHQLITTEHAVRYLCMSTLSDPEVAVYPDSNKVGVIGSAMRHMSRIGESVPYFEGED